MIGQYIQGHHQQQHRVGQHIQRQEHQQIEVLIVIQDPHQVEARILIKGVQVIHSHQEVLAQVIHNHQEVLVVQVVVLEVEVRVAVLHILLVEEGNI